MSEHPPKKRRAFIEEDPQENEENEEPQTQEMMDCDSAESEEVNLTRRPWNEYLQGKKRREAGKGYDVPEQGYHQEEVIQNLARMLKEKKNQAKTARATDGAFSDQRYFPEPWEKKAPYKGPIQPNQPTDANGVTLKLSDRRLVIVNDR